MLAGVHPLIAYAVVGLGAAGYSPAKYGIVTELLAPERLVAANGWIEGLTVASIILGFVLGGVLVSPSFGAIWVALDMPLHRPRHATQVARRRDRRGVRHLRAGGDHQPVGARHRRCATRARSIRSDACSPISAIASHAVEGPAGTDLAGGDDPVLGRGRHAAVHRVALGRGHAGDGFAARGRAAGGRRAGRVHRRGAGRDARVFERLARRAAGGRRDGGAGGAAIAAEFPASGPARPGPLGSPRAVDAVGVIGPDDADRRHGRLLRGADECAAAAPRLSAAVVGTLDRRAELQRKPGHPVDARRVCVADRKRPVRRGHHVPVRHLRGRHDEPGDHEAPGRISARFDSVAQIGKSHL